MSALSALVRVEIRQGKLDQAQADLKRTADALNHISPMDSRRPMREAAYGQAVADAQAAGLSIPEVRLFYGAAPMPGTDSGR